MFLFLSLVGATVKDNVDLKFLYENHPEFCGLPSYFVLPGLLLTMSSDLVNTSLKHTEVNLSQVFWQQHQQQNCCNVSSDLII